MRNSVYTDLDYDPDSGIFTWLDVKRKGVKAGSVAGSVFNNGYRVIMYDGKHLLAHRLAWFFLHGEFPTYMIDHINQDKLDNRACNLRLATNQMNQRNTKKSSRNTSGHRGVYWHKTKRKWYASIRVNNKQIHIGSYNCVTSAMLARKITEKFYGWDADRVVEIN